jgi:hypothetical protein
MACITASKPYYVENILGKTSRSEAKTALLGNKTAQMETQTPLMEAQNPYSGKLLIIFL